MLKKFGNKSILIIVFSGFILRLGWLYYSKSSEESGPDSIKYLAAARDLLNQGPFADSEVLRLFGSGYSGLLSLLLAINFNATAIILLQIFSYTLSVYHLSKMLVRISGEFSSFFTVSLLSFSPILIDCISSLMYEAVALILWINFLSIFISKYDAKTIFIHKDLLLLIILSFIAFIHSRYLIFSLLLSVIVTRKSHCRRKWFAFTAVFSVPQIMLLLRSFFANGTLQISGNSGVTLFIGAGGQYSTALEDQCKAEFSNVSIYSTQWDSQITRCAIDIILSDPIRWILLAVPKTLEHFEPFFLRFLDSNKTFEEVLFTGNRWIQIPFATIVIFLSTFSLYKSKSRLETLGLYHISLLSLTYPWIISIVFFGYSRYRILSLPLVYLIYSLWLEELKRKFARQNRE